MINPWKSVGSRRGKEKNLDEILAFTVCGPNGCMEWASGSSAGYPTLTLHGKLQNVTRIIAILSGFGAEIEGKMICHTCDNKRCVNPEHLYIGDAGDNAQDRCFPNSESRTKKPTLADMTRRKNLA